VDREAKKSSKLQTPNFREAPSTNLQTPKTGVSSTLKQRVPNERPRGEAKLSWCLKLEVSLEFGA
jgi:hypothetical protein